MVRGIISLIPSVADVAAEVTTYKKADVLVVDILQRKSEVITGVTKLNVERQLEPVG